LCQCLIEESNALLTAHDSINGMIDKCVSIMEALYQQIPVDDEIDAAEDEEPGEDSAHNSGEDSEDEEE